MRYYGILLSLALLHYWTSLGLCCVYFMVIIITYNQVINAGNSQSYILSFSFTSTICLSHFLSLSFSLLWAHCNGRCCARLSSFAIETAELRNGVIIIGYNRANNKIRYSAICRVKPCPHFIFKSNSKLCSSSFHKANE